VKASRRLVSRSGAPPDILNKRSPFRRALSTLERSPGAVEASRCCVAHVRKASRALRRRLTKSGPHSHEDVKGWAAAATPCQQPAPLNYFAADAAPPRPYLSHGGLGGCALWAWRAQPRSAGVTWQKKKALAQRFAAVLGAVAERALARRTASWSSRGGREGDVCQPRDQEGGGTRDPDG